MQYVEGGVALTPLDAAHIGTVEFGPVGQIFLAEPDEFSMLTDCWAEVFCKVHDKKDRP